MDTRTHDGLFVTGSLYACGRCCRLLTLDEWMQPCIRVEQPPPNPGMYETWGDAARAMGSALFCTGVLALLVYLAAWR